MACLFPRSTIALLLLQSTIAKRVDCFDDKDELRNAALRYGDNSTEALLDAETYGAVIGDWCFSETLMDLSFLFEKAYDFNEDISGWNVAYVKNMNGMFKGARSFDCDILGWNVSSVEGMALMFAEAESFNADISAWDVSSVEDMLHMFQSATSFSADISGWDVSSVEDMNGMFAGADSFDADISGWNSSSVEDMGIMFWGARSFNRDLSGWDVSSVKDMEDMFNGASDFNHNLCAWRDRMTKFNTDRMFVNSACPNQESPTSSDTPYFCRSCDSPSPSAEPSSLPSSTPSSVPSSLPSINPSTEPSESPLAVPSPLPSSTPSGAPSSLPSIRPSTQPSVSPSETPSAVPSIIPSQLPSALASSIPTVSPPQVIDFCVVDAANLENRRQGRIQSSQKLSDSVHTHSMQFDWQSMRHNRVQVEIELEAFAKSVSVATNGGPSVCIDTSLYGTRVGAFNSGDLMASYPIEVGVHRITATAYTGKNCKAGPGPTATLKLTVSYADDTAENGCSQGYIIGFAYFDKTGHEAYLQPGKRYCFGNTTIEAMVISCMESNYQIRPIQQVRFRLNDRNLKDHQPKIGYIKDNMGPVYDATFDLNPGSRYRLKADVKLEGLRKRTLLKKGFKTNGCDEL